MCGIWASIGLSPPSSVIDSVAHRGPDGRGWKEFTSSAGPIVIAHRRLAIIDTSDAAAQPMAWRNGRFWITYNGEVYNYLELRAELEGLGYCFATHSDTEVILAAYECWGEACLDRFVGMFALVIHDREAQRLFAARDRFGVKPLYFWQSGASLAFASEIKQILALPGVAARVNAARAFDFLADGLFDHTDETLFVGVRQLRGGEYLAIDLAGWRHDHRVEARRWYELPEPNSLALDEAEAAERFHALLAEAVRIHLRADVTVGSCLSGGLDSSSIVCLAVDELVRQRASNIFHTVSACFTEKTADERRFVDAVVARTGVLNAQVFPRPDDLARQIESVMRHQEEPFSSTSIFAQWCVFERARAESIKVMLDGQGADEQLAGYHGMFPLYHRQLLCQGRPDRLWRAMVERRRLHAVSLRSQMISLASTFRPRSVGRGKRRVWIGQGLQGAAPLASTVSAGHGLGQACRDLVQSTSLPMLLHYEDRNSMAHSVEARVPFLDHRLVEFSVALGDAHKMQGAVTKSVLRRGLKDVLPPAIVERQDKLGFATPEELWLKGPLRDYALQGVDESIERFPGFFEAGPLRRLVRTMLDGTVPFDFRVWRVVSFGLWGRLFAVGA
jgi:asparagine synthase (glutamine-hydrolysing)